MCTEQKRECDCGRELDGNGLCPECLKPPESCECGPVEDGGDEKEGEEW